MDENLSRGYIQLGKGRTGHDFRFTNGFSHLSPPVDKCNCIYFALVFAGVGFLLPYNSFIIAVDYFQVRYPNTTIVFDMSLVYILMAFFAVLANNILVETLSLNTRITFGYIVSFLTLLFVATCEVWWQVFSVTTSYTINLVAVAVVALGCTVQQSSFYGYTSMLPSRYTQGVMAGESAAGFLVSLNRIITKLLLDDQRINTIIFFVLSLLMVGTCFFLHQIVRRTDFVQFYITLCRESKKIVLEPTEDVGLMDQLDAQGESSGSKNQYGVLKLQQSPLSATESSSTVIGPSTTNSNNTQPYSAFGFSNPVYEPTATRVLPDTSGNIKYKVEDVVIRSGRGGTRGAATNRNPWAGLRRGLRARWEVAKSIWPFMVTIALAYFVTLCLYPGIESEIVSCKFGNWMPVILMALFNAADLVGKVLASVPYEWSRAQLIMFAWLRTLLVPLLVLCATPRGNPFIPGEGYPMLLSVLLGVTNGLIGSVPMIQAPSRVSEEHRELTGNIMTLSYNVGLTSGSLVAYLLEAILGPPLTTNSCHLPKENVTFQISPIDLSSTLDNFINGSSTLISTVPSTLTASATTAMVNSASSILLSQVNNNEDTTISALSNLTTTAFAYLTNTTLH